MKLLTKYNLACSPFQHLVNLLAGSENSSKEETIYSAGVKRVLNQALALDDCTSGYVLQWKNGVEAELDLLTWAVSLEIPINDKFLDFHTGHNTHPCALHGASQHPDMGQFSCDHIIESLYGRIVSMVRSNDREQNLGPMEREEILKNELQRKLGEMPRQIGSQKGRPGEIKVTWADKENTLNFEQHGLIFECRVTLHRERVCAEKKKSELLGYGKP